MATTVQVAKTNGIRIPVLAWQASQRVGIPFPQACAVLEQESAGLNIFGHDGGDDGWCSGADIVTPTRYRAYKAGRGQHGAQGVGPMQLTWPPYHDRADGAGGCWVPTHNDTVGFQILKGLVDAGKTWHEAAAAYNGSETYADLGYSKPLFLFQGCYSDGSKSAGTHTGSSVYDLYPDDIEATARLGALHGIIVFHRPYNWDGAGGGEHLHCASSAAARRWHHRPARRSPTGTSTSTASSPTPPTTAPGSGEAVRLPQAEAAAGAERPTVECRGDALRLRNAHPPWGPNTLRPVSQHLEAAAGLLNDFLDGDPST